MIEFHSNLGGLWYWILIKHCQTKLSEEQTGENKRRNLYFLSFLNIVFVLIVPIFLLYPLYI